MGSRLGGGDGGNCRLVLVELLIFYHTVYTFNKFKVIDSETIHIALCKLCSKVLADHMLYCSIDCYIENFSHS